MRVIAGRAKGHKLRMVPGGGTRPIMDRVKENLFNVIGDWVEDSRWLDLFAGTGQVGIEALSRGACEVVFVDKSPIAIKTINQNLTHTKLMDQAIVIQGDAFSLLKPGGRDLGLFDFIYIAPPQYKGLWSEILALIDRSYSHIMNDEGQIIVQIDPKELAALELRNLRQSDQRKYGNTILCFYEMIRPST